MRDAVLVTDNWGPPIETIEGPFAGSLAVGEGWLTKRQLRSGLFTRLFQNSYVPSAIPITHELRCRAVAAIAPAGAVITGLSAAAVRGFDLAGAHDPVEVLVPEDVQFAAQRGVHIRRTRRGTIDNEPWHGVGLATPMRMTLDILTNSKLHRSLPRTVGYLDVLLREGLVDRDALRTWLVSRHENGILRARQAAELSDGRAESIPESELRVLLVLDDVIPDVQLKVYDRSGRYLGRLDLAFGRYKLAVEYDGEWHKEQAQRRFDAERRARFRADGWEFVIVTKEQLYGDPRGTVRAVREALSRRSAGTWATAN